MDSKPLLFGLIGFFAGGLLVSVAATTFEAPEPGPASMQHMTRELEGKTGDEFDRAFIAHMIDHHQSAINMAELAADRARHDEIRQLSGQIIVTQGAEIDQLKQWQQKWGYAADDAGHGSGGH